MPFKCKSLLCSFGSWKHVLKNLNWNQIVCNLYLRKKKQTHQYWDCQTLFDGSLKLLCTEISSLLCGQSCIFVWS